VALTGTVGASATGGGGAGMVSVNVITDKTEAYLTDTHYTNSGTAAGLVKAVDKSWIISLGFAAGGGSGTSAGGALGVNVIANTVSAHLLNTDLDTGGSLTVQADSGTTIGSATVGVAVSVSGAAVAGSLSANVLKNTTQAYISGPSEVTADGPIA